MINSMIALAPAGVLGQGSADARPSACIASRPALLPAVGVTVAVAEGTRVPFAGAVLGMRRRGVDLPPAGNGLPAPQQHDPITQNDGTTPLGIHLPGRPTS
jgi:hypothetical protein